MYNLHLDEDYFHDSSTDSKYVDVDGEDGVLYDNLMENMQDVILNAIWPSLIKKDQAFGDYLDLCRIEADIDTLDEYSIAAILAEGDGTDDNAGYFKLMRKEVVRDCDEVIAYFDKKGFTFERDY